MTTYTITPWPTGAEIPRSIFFFETFHPELMNLIGRYQDGFLKNYIDGELHTNLVKPVEPLLPDIDADSKDMDYYKILSNKYDRDFRNFELQRLEIANLKNAIVSSLDRATQLAILGDPVTIMEMDLPAVYNTLRKASTPRQTDISMIMSRLSHSLNYNQPQSFENYCIEFRNTISILNKFQCSRSEWEYVQILKTNLENSNFAPEFAPFVAQYDVSHPKIADQNIEELIQFAAFAIGTIETKIVSLGLDRTSLHAVQLTKDSVPANKDPLKKKFYCHTCGTNHNHSSQRCNTPGPKHDKTANYYNQKGGKPSN